jgi:hypothetical protein
MIPVVATIEEATTSGVACALISPPPHAHWTPWDQGAMPWSVVFWPKYRASQEIVGFAPQVPALCQCLTREEAEQILAERQPHGEVLTQLMGIQTAEVLVSMGQPRRTQLEIAFNRVPPLTQIVWADTFDQARFYAHKLGRLDWDSE